MTQYQHILQRNCDEMIETSCRQLFAEGAYSVYIQRLQADHTRLVAQMRERLARAMTKWNQDYANPPWKSAAALGASVAAVCAIPIFPLLSLLPFATFIGISSAVSIVGACVLNCISTRNEYLSELQRVLQMESEWIDRNLPGLEIARDNGDEMAGNLIGPLTRIKQSIATIDKRTSDEYWSTPSNIFAESGSERSQREQNERMNSHNQMMEMGRRGVFNNGIHMTRMSRFH